MHAVLWNYCALFLLWVLHYVEGSHRQSINSYSFPLLYLRFMLWLIYAVTSCFFINTVMRQAWNESRAADDPRRFFCLCCHWLPAFVRKKQKVRNIDMLNMGIYGGFLPFFLCINEEITAKLGRHGMDAMEADNTENVCRGGKKLRWKDEELRAMTQRMRKVGEDYTDCVPEGLLNGLNLFEL